jgi:superfamily II DNA helicase RecQ
LLRYFNEKTKKTCGRCDVCQKQAMNRVLYETIEEKVRSVMREDGQSVKDVLAQCAEYDESVVLDSIRFLVDNGVLQLDSDGKVKTNGHKKSRQ